MGYIKVPRIYDLEFEGDREGLVVRMKGIKFGKVRRLLSVLGGDQDADLSDEDIETVFSELLDNIVSWNMEDEEGVPIPVTRESLEDEEFRDILDIFGKWLEVLTGPSDDLGKDSASGATFPVALPTMEAL